MPDEIENILQSFRPAGPPPGLREKILTSSLNVDVHPVRFPWARYVFRAGIAASLLISFLLLHAANKLNRDSATVVGIGPPRWTAEAQQAADLIDPNGNAGRQYIALALRADRARPTPSVSQGDLR